jgi:hypothetical protein
MDVVMLLCSWKLKFVQWFEKFLILNAAGMTYYYTPIEYEHIHLVFATLGCVYKIWWSQLVRDSAYNEVTPASFAFWSIGTLVQSITF